MEAVWLIVGSGIGAAVAWIIANARNSTKNQDISNALLLEQERSKTLGNTVNELKSDLDTARSKVLEANNSLASTEADYRNLQEKLNDQKKELETIQNKFAAEFK